MSSYPAARYGFEKSRYPAVWNFRKFSLKNTKKPNIYTESLGISEHQSNAYDRRRFRWYFLWIFHEIWLDASKHKYFLCRKSAIPLYAEARQCHLLKVPCNFWIRLSFLNKHLTFSEGFRRIFSENLRKFQTAGYLVFSKPYPAAGYVDTGGFLRPNVLNDACSGTQETCFVPTIFDLPHPLLPGQGHFELFPPPGPNNWNCPVGCPREGGGVVTGGNELVL